MVADNFDTLAPGLLAFLTSPAGIAHLQHAMSLQPAQPAPPPSVINPIPPQLAVQIPFIPAPVVAAHMGASNMGIDPRLIMPPNPPILPPALFEQAVPSSSSSSVKPLVPLLTLTEAEEMFPSWYHLGEESDYGGIGSIDLGSTDTWSEDESINSFRDYAFGSTPPPPPPSSAFSATYSDNYADVGGSLVPVGSGNLAFNSGYNSASETEYSDPGMEAALVYADPLARFIQSTGFPTDPCSRCFNHNLSHPSDLVRCVVTGAGRRCDRCVDGHRVCSNADPKGKAVARFSQVGSVGGSEQGGGAVGGRGKGWARKRVAMGDDGKWEFGGPVRKKQKVVRVLSPSSDGGDSGYIPDFDSSSADGIFQAMLATSMAESDSGSVTVRGDSPVLGSRQALSVYLHQKELTHKRECREIQAVIASLPE